MTVPMLGNNIITQVGIIVHDIESKARAWSEILGLPMPNIIITDTVDKTQAEYSGKSTTARANDLGMTCPERLKQTLDLAQHPIPAELWERLETVGNNTEDL